MSGLSRYERPLGPWAQRIAGGVLAIAIVSVVWALEPSVVATWKHGMAAGEAVAGLIGVAAVVSFLLLAIRLMRAKPAGADVLTPVALIGFGITYALALCAVGGIFWTEHVAVGAGWELLDGFILAAVAIAIGIQRRRRRSTTDCVPRIRQ